MALKNLMARLAIVEDDPSTVAANDTPPTTATDPDRACWPHSVAMNTGEIDLFLKRQERFTGLGLAPVRAEQLADRLVQRDREGDDRRVCFECAHLNGWRRWSCGNWRAAGVARDGLAFALVATPQRCPGFAGALS